MDPWDLSGELRPDARTLRGQGHHHRALGNRRRYSGKTVCDSSSVSRMSSLGESSRQRRRAIHRQLRAQRDGDFGRTRSRTSAQPEIRFSTPPPIPSCRSRRTRKSCRSSGFTKFAESRARMPIDYRIGRVIARPFVGAAGKFSAHGAPARFFDAAAAHRARGLSEDRTVIGIGKISDIFAGRGINQIVSHDFESRRDGDDRPSCGRRRRTGFSSPIWSISTCSSGIAAMLRATPKPCVNSTTGWEIFSRAFCLTTSSSSRPITETIRLSRNGSHARGGAAFCPAARRKPRSRDAQNLRRRGRDAGGFFLSSHRLADGRIISRTMTTNKSGERTHRR